MNTAEMLQQIQGRALKEEKLREKILATEHTKDPLDEFCKVCQQEGYEI